MIKAKKMTGMGKVRNTVTKMDEALEMMKAASLLGMTSKAMVQGQWEIEGNVPKEEAFNINANQIKRGWVHFKNGRGRPGPKGEIVVVAMIKDENY